MSSLHPGFVVVEGTAEIISFIPDITDATAINEIAGGSKVILQQFGPDDTDRFDGGAHFNDRDRALVEAGFRAGRASNEETFKSL